MTDEEIRLAAIEYARKNKNRIAKEFTDKHRYLPDSVPISTFMAGSPGAGKTEFSKRLIEAIEELEGIKHPVLRIDGDEIRELIPGYNGKNSSLFQAAIFIIVDRIHDLVLKQNQSFVFDGTFSDYDKAAQNIRRSLTKDRLVNVFYVYQEPQVAWKFTQAREDTEGRNIPKSGFIDAFLGSRETVEQIRREFEERVAIFLVKKDFEKNTVEAVVPINPGGKQIDDYRVRRYSRNELENLI